MIIYADNIEEAVKIYEERHLKESTEEKDGDEAEKSEEV